MLEQNDLYLEENGTNQFVINLFVTINLKYAIYPNLVTFKTQFSLLIFP